MINDFTLVLMTKNIDKQLGFYNSVLGLDLLFRESSVIGLGKNNRLYLILREDLSESSHHTTENKGPQIITFTCQGDINSYVDKIIAAGFKFRDKLHVPEINSYFVFIEDYDGNEICLNFPLH